MKKEQRGTPRTPEGPPPHRQLLDLRSELVGVAGNLTYGWSAYRDNSSPQFSSPELRQQLADDSRTLVEGVARFQERGGTPDQLSLGTLTELDLARQSFVQRVRRDR